MRVSSLLLTLSIFASVGCSEPKPQIIHFVPPDDGLKRETWKDEALKIGFKTPRDGWAHEKTHPKTQDGAFVVSSDASRCLGWAYRTPLPPDAPLAPANAAQSALSLQSSQVIMDEFFKYEVFHARQWEVSGREGEARVSYRAIFAVAGEELLTIQARAEGSDYGQRRRCLDAVIGGFNFL